ncbi:MAG: DUF4189 domain-containing protein [Hyphomicrobiaceae bacterium]
MPRANSRILLATAALAAALAVPAPVFAEGAIAVGMPADVAKEGVAFGWVVGSATRQDAERTALKQCHDFKDAPESTRALCAVMRTFKNECFSIALDPEPGTPGVGWAILPTQAAADSKAMADCRATAGRGRESYCQVTGNRCDGSAK